MTTFLLPPCIAGPDPDSMSCANRYRLCRELHCHRRILDRKQHAFHQRDVQTHVHWVKSGLLRLYQTLANGNRQIVGFAFPGEFVDLATNGQYRFSAQAVDATEVRTMPRPLFEAAARENAEFSFRLFLSVSATLSRASDLTLTVGRRGAEESLASFLLEMHERTQAGDPATRDIYLPMLRTDIADYLGLAPETISRVFTRFTRTGLIALCSRRGVRLLDWTALKHLAEGQPKREPQRPSSQPEQRLGSGA